MAEAPFDLPGAQRWFAVECNNAAWNLLDKPNRTADETERMLHTAHASVHHWLAAGDELNRLRGMVLLANVYAGAGLASNAIRYAEQALACCDAVGEMQTAFDRATTYGAASRANAAAGNMARARHYLYLAQEAAAKMDEGDRPIFDQLCPKL